MKQIFYIVAVVVLLIIAHRVMAKIKDVPDENEGVFLEDNEEESKEEELKNELLH
ncbi:MAG: hypothetical protein LBP72_09375 [Dysgonamonadaceae bacterium]|jgi:uncharacterized protein YxeA|nr:hypothetical protein [Dysgonamonadaceae bacterium]